jgi:exocyst complex protein 7
MSSRCVSLPLSLDSGLTLAKQEHALLAQLAPLPEPRSLDATFGAFVNPVLALFSSTLASLTTMIKRALHKHTFLALSAYSAVHAAQARWERAVISRVGGERRADELRDVLNGIRAVCLRSFPEFLADIKLAAVGKTGEATGLADFTVSVCVRSAKRYRNAHARSRRQSHI